MCDGVDRWLNDPTKTQWWLYTECKKPRREFYDETTIPHKGCYDYVFGCKSFIRKEQRILLGRLDQWGRRTLEVIDKFQQSGKFPESCFEKQKKFVLNLMPNLLVELSEFDYCVLSVLKKEVLYRLFQSVDSVDATILLYEMTNSKTFEILAIPSINYDNFDVVTRFDNDIYEDFAFGKEDDERVDIRNNRSNDRRKRVKK